MIPIDGEKLIESLDDTISCLDINDQVDRYTISVLTSIKKHIEKPEFNLKPGTLVIQREEGYEKRECDTCYLFHPVDLTCLHNFKYCKCNDPWCKYHITESELEAAYIVGGEE